MKNSFAFAALVGLVAASPAPQMMDFDAILAAPAPALVGPPLTLAASNQTSVYNQATADALASQTAVSAAVASATGSAQKAKRGLVQDLLNILLPPPKTTAKSTSKTSSTAYPTSTTASVRTSTAAPSTTAASSTSQQVSSTTSSSASACPTQPEEGTYCGFINPEDPCAPQPDGYGPKVVPDTVDAFEAYPEFHKEAQNEPTPSGYVNTFRDLNASVNANSYLGLHTLSSYDALGCSQWCDNTTLCTGFNLYIERDPSLNPTTNDTFAPFNCPNPSSITNYKCTLWGSGVEPAAAVNYGGYRDQFQVVIAGSNGYEKTNNTTPDTQPGWQPPTKCPLGSAINKPSTCLGKSFFPGPFDPSVCASYANAQTKVNKAQLGNSAQSVSSFNAYCVKKNGIPQGTWCSLYSDVVSNSWATYTGGWGGNNWFGIESSWTYAVSK